MLHEYLQDLSKHELEEVARTANIDLSRSKTKKQIVLRLLEPQDIEMVRNVVAPKDLPPDPLSSDLLRKVQLHMDEAAIFRPQGTRRRPLVKAQMGKEEADPLDAPLQICDVRKPLRGMKGRQALKDLNVGGKTSGRIVEVSLLDGVRIDIGAEVDALVPVPTMKDNLELAESIHQTYPLGSKVEVQIEDISDNAARRFPVICSFTRQKIDLPDWKSVQMALRPQESGTQSLHTKGNVDLEDSDDWQPEGETQLDALLEEVPQRSPPKEVMSFGNGKLQAIQVPEQFRAGKEASAASDKVRKAWTSFMEDEVASLRHRLRCQHRLARDLETIEAELQQGNTPTVPVDLLGMTVLPDGRRCLLPAPDGDCLKFQIQEFGTPGELQHWITSCREHHQDQWSLRQSQVTGEGPAAKHQLAKFYACADAWHARAVEAAEREEVRKLQYHHLTCDESDPQAMQQLDQVIEDMIASCPELQEQEEMKGQYVKERELS